MSKAKPTTGVKQNVGRCPDCEELNTLFNLQRRRMKPLEKLWQAAHDARDTWPDLGELCKWAALALQETRRRFPQPICPRCLEVMVFTRREVEDGWIVYWMCGCANKGPEQAGTLAPPGEWTDHDVVLAKSYGDALYKIQVLNLRLQELERAAQTVCRWYSEAAIGEARTTIAPDDSTAWMALEGLKDALKDGLVRIHGGACDQKRTTRGGKQETR